MLRKFVKMLIPSRGDIFFDLFIQASENIHQSSNLLAEILNTNDKLKTAELAQALREQRQSAIDINKKITEQLNHQFITPIDRGEIQQMSVLLLKLTKRIIKIDRKLQIYSLGSSVDDCLIRSVNTLQNITKTLIEMMVSLKSNDFKNIEVLSQKADELDENVIEDLGHALREISVAQYDMLTIIKLKEVYKAIEGAINTSATLCDTVMRISVKEI